MSLRDPEPGHPQFVLSEKHQQQWTAHTYAARSCELTLKRVVDVAMSTGSGPAATM
jgi:hypothetical protein